MPLPDHIRQPGPPATDRIVAVAGTGRRFNFALSAGMQLIDGIRQGFAAAGFESGIAELDGITLAPFSYVMPALSKTSANAAFYSDVFQPDGQSRITSGAMTFGRRDHAPFFHGHGLWHEADGRLHGGHILPVGTVVAEQVTVRAIGLSGMAFLAAPDPEINFTVFGPVATVTGPACTTRVIALRLRPNQDVCTAIETCCHAHGISHAHLRGGVGSTIGAHFDDGRIAPNFATEVYIKTGSVSPGDDGKPVASLDIGLVDYTGLIAEGRLARGRNPVLMTFELVIEAITDV